MAAKWRYQSQDPQALGGVKYRREPSENFKRNLEGWRDVWSFTDKVLQAIENTEYIAGLRLVKENNIEYGPFTEDGALVSYYPYWFCWVQSLSSTDWPQDTRRL